MLVDIVPSTHTSREEVDATSLDIIAPDTLNLHGHELKDDG